MEDFSEEEFDVKIGDYFSDKNEFKWAKYKTEGPTTLWTCEVGGKTWTKSVSVVPLSTSSMFKVFNRLDLIIKRSPNVSEMKYVEKNENWDVVFIHVPIGIPFVSNRYDVFKRRWKKHEKGFYLAAKSIVDKSFEKLKKTKSDLKMNNFTLRNIEEFVSKNEEKEEVEGENETCEYSKITSISTKCMAGKLPTRLTNMGLFKQPFKEIGRWESVAKELEKL